MELELIASTNGLHEPVASRVLIDNWDPQIRCPTQCGDFAPPNGLGSEDFVVLLAEMGRSFDPINTSDAAKYCLDSKVSFDQYIDFNDVFIWDTFLNGSGLNACGSGVIAKAIRPNATSPNKKCTCVYPVGDSSADSGKT